MLGAGAFSRVLERAGVGVSEQRVLILRNELGAASKKRGGSKSREQLI